jgi:hypothetical protein
MAPKFEELAIRMMQHGGEARPLLRAMKGPTESMAKTVVFFGRSPETCGKMAEEQWGIDHKFINSWGKT